jgi:acyl-CoA thioesterase-2
MTSESSRGNSPAFVLASPCRAPMHNSLAHGNRVVHTSEHPTKCGLGRFRVTRPCRQSGVQVVHMGLVGPETSNTSAEPFFDDASLKIAIESALDGLLLALRLEPLGRDRFQAPAEPGRFDRVFGGQVVAQALLAASATVTAKSPHSLHAYFVEAGIPGQPVEVSVDRVRDGRSISSRRVAVMQGEREILIAMVSFHTAPEEFELPESPSPESPSPEWSPDDLPRLQNWVRDPSPAKQAFGLSWIEQPPPVELRMSEPPNFMGGPNSQGPRTHWMRLPHAVGRDPLLQAALLAYASDYLLLDMIPRARSERESLKSFVGFSLDHAIWFHRPIRLEGWHRYSQQAEALSEDRGLVRGTIHDIGGRLVASVMQEGLVRSTR